jgi:hypothetical protein
MNVNFFEDVMNYLSKLPFAALIAFSLLFASDANINEMKDECAKLSQNTRLSTDADIALVESISCCDFLIPDIEYWLFGDTSYPDATKIQWTPSVLEKLSFGQLMALVKEGDVDPKNLLWIPFTHFVCQRPKTD